MIIGSHNSWSYLPPKKFWMKLIKFTAKCQSLNIKEQYKLGVRCFDLRVRFNKDKIAKIYHGIIEYNYSPIELYEDLSWLNKQSDKVYIRILHEIRNKKNYTIDSINSFIDFIELVKFRFPKLIFWCGRNLYNWEKDYDFGEDPTCDEKYASVCSPKLIDDWIPWWFAFRNNKKIVKEGTDKDILLIDFVEYVH